jgi:hypothetical protein
MTAPSPDLADAYLRLVDAHRRWEHARDLWLLACSVGRETDPEFWPGWEEQQ